MKQLVFATFWFLSSFGLTHAQTTNTRTQSMPEQSHTLSAEQQSIVAISALTAKGDLSKLNGVLNRGLDAGLTINESKEVLVHLYAYCGFPRSLNGINTLMAIVEDRKKKGINDEVGPDATPIKEDGNKYERGKRILETLTRQKEAGPKTGFAAFSPEIDRFLKEHLFADIFERDVLSFKDREIATISALVSLGGVEPQLKSHIAMGLNVGLTVRQVEQLLSVIESNVGKAEAEAGRKVLSDVAESKNAVTKGEPMDQTKNANQSMSVSRPGSQAGTEGPAQNFTGTVHVEPVFAAAEPSRLSGGRVTFEPGARSAWHTHPLGQTLIVTSGTGWVQQEGGPKREIREGEVVWTPPGVKHWHGATATTAMTHIAIQEALGGKVVEWMEKVSDEQYNAR